MKKQKLMILGGVILMLAMLVIIVIQMPKWADQWSRKSYEAIIQETVVQPDGEVRLIVERVTEIYSDPLNALRISEHTVFVDREGRSASVEQLQPGDRVEVTLKDSFIEETPYYYPTVYKISILQT